jgi:hypothetical protein
MAIGHSHIVPHLCKVLTLASIHVVRFDSTKSNNPEVRSTRLDSITYKSHSSVPMDPLDDPDLHATAHILDIKLEIIIGAKQAA